MKPVIIKLSIADTVVHVNANHIVYFYPKKTDDGKLVTVLHLEKNIVVEVLESMSEIDVLIEAGSL
ncbi:MAG: hypothetical protein H7Y03_10705 [Chitinophagaceae bacterium]|nr:hypothetical protein [Chitinophagaceae bacterium]